MSDAPSVSIVMIFLDAEPFIEEAIASVFAQSYSDWELLLVDDGSTDASTAIALRCAAAHPAKVRYLEHIRHQNHGMSASRNLGIRNARGEYIAFLDADDVWLPHKLERQVRMLDAHPQAAMVYGRDQYWHSWTGHPEDRRRDYVHRLNIPANIVVQPPALLKLFLTERTTVPCPTNILVRRTAIEHVAGFEEAFRGIYDVYEDQAFYTKMCLSMPILVSHECWDRYRQHPDSRCAVVERRGQSNAARLFFLKWVVAYLSAHGIRDRALWDVLRLQLLLCRFPGVHRAFRRAQSTLRAAGALLRRGALRILPPPAR